MARLGLIASQPIGQDRLWLGGGHDRRSGYADIAETKEAYSLAHDTAGEIGLRPRREWKPASEGPIAGAWTGFHAPLGPKLSVPPPTNDGPHSERKVPRL